MSFGVDAVHRLHLLRRPVLHLHDAGGLQDAAPGLHVGVHLHLLRVDGGVDDHPSAAPQLAVLRDVDEDGVLVPLSGGEMHGDSLGRQGLNTILRIMS